MRASTELPARLSITIMLALIALAGCQSSDLNGYRPLEKSAQVNSPGAKADQSISENEDASGASSADNATISSSGESAGIVPVSALSPVNVVDGSNVSTLLKLSPSAPMPDDQPEKSTKVATTTSNEQAPRRVEVLIPEKTFQTDAKSKALRITYDDLDLLKVLNLEPVTPNAVELMPQWLRNLDGQRVKLRGFMYPTFESEGIERFVLARDNQICCFGRDPKVYDLVQVDLESGRKTSYIPATRSFDVVGRFKIEITSEDGKPYGLYYLEDAQVIDR